MFVRLLLAGGRHSFTTLSDVISHFKILIILVRRPHSSPCSNRTNLLLTLERWGDAKLLFLRLFKKFGVVYKNKKMIETKGQLILISQTNILFYYMNDSHKLFTANQSSFRIVVLFSAVNSCSRMKQRPKEETRNWY